MSASVSSIKQRDSLIISVMTSRKVTKAVKIVLMRYAFCGAKCSSRRISVKPEASKLMI